MKRFLLLLSILLLVGCQSEDVSTQPKQTVDEAVENVEVVEETYSHDKWLEDEQVEVIDRLDYDDRAIVIASKPDTGYELIVLSEGIKGSFIRWDLPYPDIYIDKEQINHLEVKELKNPVLIVHGDPVASSPGRVLIYDLNTLDELLSDEAENLTWIDVDGDGIYEIHATTMYGQVIYDIGFSYVYALKDGKYKPDYDLTRQYVYDELSAKKLILKQNLTLENLSKVLETYAYLGDKSACRDLLETYEAFLKDYPQVYDSESDDFFRYRFSMWDVMSAEYEDKWVRYRYLDNLNQIFLNENLSWNEYRNLIYDDLDDDGIEEALVSFSRDSHTDYGMTYLMDEETYMPLQGQSGYYVDEMKVLPFGEDLLIYEQVTNGVYPLGSALTKYENNELITLYSKSSPTGSGYSSLLDADEDGIYEGISHSVSDYGVFFHPIEWITLYKDGEMIDSQINYYLEPIPTEAKEFVFHYLDVLWLSETYGANEKTANRLMIMGTNDINTEKLNDFIFVMYNDENRYEDDIVRIEKITESNENIVYSVKTIGEKVIEIHVTVNLLDELKIIKIETL